MGKTTEPPALISDFFDDLPDYIRGRIKAELLPGERILWASRPVLHPSGLGRDALVAAGFVVGLWSICGVCLAGFFGAFGGKNSRFEGPLVVLGLIAGVVGCLVVFGMIMSRRDEREKEGRVAEEFYALTDRRAIIWRPGRDFDARPDLEPLEVHSIFRGQIGHVHRVEYADGSGAIQFALSGDVRPTFWPTLQFESIFEVRRVEDLVRATLIGPARKPEDE
jgi:hypothetical protein